MSDSGVGAIIENLRALPRNLKNAFCRHGAPVTDRARSQSVVSNVFLHIHSARTHRYSLKATFTLGLGIAAISLFFILAATGILLMVYYKPSVAAAYNSVKDIHYVVPTGRLMRNVHRWSAHLMVAAVLLHMMRVVYTGAYKRGREVNWLIGMVLLVLTLGLSYTGYLLPWDQLAYWATTIGANIASSPNELTDALGITHVIDIGAMQKHILLGANTVGEDALVRFYWLHCVVLPMGLSVFVAAHFWRIRKDGGMSRPDDLTEADLAGTPVDDKAEKAFDPSEKKTYGLMCVVPGGSPHVGRGPEHTVQTWPHVFYAELAVLATVFAIVLALGLAFDAPLKEAANPAVPENPAKAPWYFIGLQELVSYSAFMGGIGIPALAVMGMSLLPLLDREEKGAGRWLGGNADGRKITLHSTVVATVVTVLTLAFTVRFGWLRDWFPDVPQIVITFVNPGTLITALFVWWSIVCMRRYRGTHAGVLAIFTTVAVAFVIMTYFSTVHRGPNWAFYWSMSAWPVH